MIKEKYLSKKTTLKTLKKWLCGVYIPLFVIEAKTRCPQLPPEKKHKKFRKLTLKFNLNLNISSSLTELITKIHSDCLLYTRNHTIFSDV